MLVVQRVAHRRKPVRKKKKKILSQSEGPKWDWKLWKENFALMDQFKGSITTPVEIGIESILNFRIFQMRFFYTSIPVLEKGPLSFTLLYSGLTIDHI